MTRLDLEIVVTEMARQANNITFVAEELREFFDRNPADKNEMMHIMGGFRRAASFFDIIGDFLIQLREESAELEGAIEEGKVFADA